jgi:hypothetical protein
MAQTYYTQLSILRCLTFNFIVTEHKKAFPENTDELTNY